MKPGKPLPVPVIHALLNLLDGEMTPEDESVLWQHYSVEPYRALSIAMDRTLGECDPSAFENLRTELRGALIDMLNVVPT